MRNSVKILPILGGILAGGCDNRPSATPAPTNSWNSLVSVGSPNNKFSISLSKQLSIGFQRYQSFLRAENNKIIDLSQLTKDQIRIICQIPDTIDFKLGTIRYSQDGKSYNSLLVAEDSNQLPLAMFFAPQGSAAATKVFNYSSLELTRTSIKQLQLLFSDSKKMLKLFGGSATPLSLNDSIERSSILLNVGEILGLKNAILELGASNPDGSNQRTVHLNLFGNKRRWILSAKYINRSDLRIFLHGGWEELLTQTYPDFFRKVIDPDVGVLGIESQTTQVR